MDQSGGRETGSHEVLRVRHGSDSGVGALLLERKKKNLNQLLYPFHLVPMSIPLTQSLLLLLLFT